MPVITAIFLLTFLLFHYEMSLAWSKVVHVRFLSYFSLTPDCVAQAKALLSRLPVSNQMQFATPGSPSSL